MRASIRLRIVTTTAAVIALLAIAAARIASAQPAVPAKAANPESGRVVFNNRCAHCHGEDAAAEDGFYNLPQLLSDKSGAFFFKTVTKGIPEKGMPPWKGVLQRRDMADILAFIRAVEREQGIAVARDGSN